MTPLLYTTPKAVLPLALSLHLLHSEAEAGLGQDVDEVACVVARLARRSSTIVHKHDEPPTGTVSRALAHHHRIAGSIPS